MSLGPHHLRSRVVDVTARVIVAACFCAFIWCSPSQAGSNDINRLYRRLADQPKDVELLEKLRQTALAEQDAVVKVDALVLYCLGSTYVGREKEAERIRSYLTTVHRDQPAVARLLPSKLNDACERCSGSGKASNTCVDCGGTGICKNCEGKGTRFAPGLGGDRVLPCPLCHGSGRCRACSGNGKEDTVCADCLGRDGVPSSDRVKEAYRAMFVHVLKIDESASGSSGSTEADATADEAGSQWHSMSEYVEAVNVLRDLYKSGAVSTADFQTVFADPAKYTGLVLRCEVHLQDYHARAISVSAKADAAQGGSAVLSPENIYIGSKAGRIVKEFGYAAPAVVTFGLLTANQNILFDIEKPAEVAPAEK